MMAQPNKFTPVHEDRLNTRIKLKFPLGRRRGKGPHGVTSTDMVQQLLKIRNVFFYPVVREE